MLAGRSRDYKWLDHGTCHGSPIAGDDPVKRSIAHACIGLALAACLAAALATAQQTAQQAAQLAAQQPTGPTDPLEYFAEMMPVFSHDRCTGCHGRVNPELATGNNHSMGQFTNPADCNDCHTQAPDWKTRPDLTFFNQNTKQLCQMQSTQVERMRDSARAASIPIAVTDATYLRHLSGDSLIGAAFTGTAAGAFGRANPPPMKRTDFVAAADAWLKVGAGCGGWNGKITQTETFRSYYSYAAAAGNGSMTSVQEVASRRITIWRRDGVSTASVTASGSSTVINTMRFPDGPNGPCTAVATSTGRWNSTVPADSEAEISIAIDANGGSTIRFSTPEEVGTSSSDGDLQNDCGIPLPAGGGGEPPVQHEWKPWVFMIRCPSDHAICQLFDPDSRTLSGTMERTITDHMDAAEPQSWLSTGPVGISRSDDGTSIPVKVTTTWDLTLED